MATQDMQKSLVLTIEIRSLVSGDFTYLVTVTVLVGVEVVRRILGDPVVTVIVLVWGAGVTVDVFES